MSVSTRSLRPNQFLRMIKNAFVTSEATFIDMAAWDDKGALSMRRTDAHDGTSASRTGCVVL
jgi:hypothetical protein